MTNQERISNLKTLGYTDREAEFLCLAALHSGYFVRRQFLAFVGKAFGWADVALAEKVVKYGHAKAQVLRHNRTLYNLCSKPFFEALGEPDNRNRRAHEVLTIKSRLMALDFVIQHPNVSFLGTEREKVEYFSGAQIDPQDLPRKRYVSEDRKVTTDRYFVDKYPIFLSGDDHSPIPIVQFCYIDEGQHGTSRFENYLQQYRALFVRISVFRVVYVACFPEQFEPARRAFVRMILNGGGCPPIDPLITRLLSYFEDRDAYEKKDFKRFTQPKLIQFREDRDAFESGKYDGLFEVWKTGGDRAILQKLAPQSTERPSGARAFLGHELRFRYELFGNLHHGNFGRREG